jgi:soluble lytic murein transglycosylase-like protein
MPKSNVILFVLFLFMSHLAWSSEDEALDINLEKAECNYIKAYAKASKKPISCDTQILPPLSLVAYVRKQSIPVYYLYVEKEAVSFNLPPLILLAIIKHESGKTCMMKPNSDGTYDMGRAQINTIHSEELAVKRGISMESVACDDRINALVAAWHLKNKRNELYHRGEHDIWSAVGRYHDKRKSYSAPYIRKVKKSYIALLRRFT